jgi:hypothetical protein
MYILYIYKQFIFIAKNARRIVDPKIRTLMFMTDDIPWLEDQIKLFKVTEPEWKVIHEDSYICVYIHMYIYIYMCIVYMHPLMHLGLYTWMYIEYTCVWIYIYIRLKYSKLQSQNGT